MHFQKLTGACLLALASFSLAAPTTSSKSTAKTTSTSVKSSSTSLKASSTSSVKVSSSTTSSKSSTSSVASSSSKASSSSIVSTSSKASSSSVASSSTSSLVADAACTNGPLTRSCWSNGYSIATDFDQKHPTTGNTVSYSLDVSNTTCNPDGHGSQQCLLINNQYPGPVITANWGDMIEITVTNSMQDNGTSIHWHGIRQLNSNGADGVNGITECPLAPGQTKTYTFQATQFGTSWYHSHHSSQYGMGVVGTIVINGPASSNYDVDLGTFPITEWYYADADVVNVQTLNNLQLGEAPPNADTILLNGTNGNAGGKYQEVTVQPGKKHRLRLINTSVDNFIRVKLDDHPFTVMTADFIPVKPMPGQDWVLLAIGQRYDVVFTANQTAATYWFRAEVATDCLSANNGNGRALFTYAGQAVSAPTDDDEVAPSNGCTELNTTPYWAQAVPSGNFASQLNTFDQGLQLPGVEAGEYVVLWALNTTAMNINWGAPTLQYLFNGNTAYPAEYEVVNLPTEGEWTYWLVQVVPDSPPTPHPIHLHGHDFFVLGSGSGTFDISTMTSTLNFANPPRRDTSTLPGNGWLAIAFQTNNPGAWLMHCHIAWHISEGLGVQFLEAPSQIVMPDETQFNTQCSAWNSYASTMAWPQIDSGL